MRRLWFGGAKVRVYLDMLPMLRVGERGPLLIMLHWLGGGAQSWLELSQGLAARGVRCAALDLPGFGEATAIAGYTVAEKVEAVIETLRELRSTLENGDVPWVIAGHSMGGKVALAVARRALDGEPGLGNLRGIVLTSPSTPSPEPMSETRRDQLLETFEENQDHPDKEAAQAASWVDHNIGTQKLPAHVRDRAIAGVLSIHRRALRAWFQDGSREDWSDRVGQLTLPALVFAGTKESSLGPEAQAKSTMPHLPKGKLIVLDGVGHLAPLERPGELLEHLTLFFADLGLTLTTPDAAPSGHFQELFASERVSPATREVMTNRLQLAQNWNHTPRFFTPEEFRTVRALVHAVVPGAPFDIAASLDTQLQPPPADNPETQPEPSGGDGWRFADLPPDGEAWRRGLHSLDLAAHREAGVSFLALFPDAQARLLEQATEGKLGAGLLGSLHLGANAAAYSAHEMDRWFEEVRAECTKAYIADPRSMDRIGYTGFADDLGFTQIQLGAREDFDR